jgi:hypothetical protein
MPRNEDGSWRPPDQFPTWDEWRTAFVLLACEDGWDDVYRLTVLCERTRENPGTYCRRWAWELKVKMFECGKLIPRNWPSFLTAGDWKSLAMFAEHEAANAGA